VISAEAEVYPAGAGDHGKTGSSSAIAGVALGNEPKAACRTLSSAAQPEVVLAANDLTSLVINEPHLASQRRASSVLRSLTISVLRIISPPASSEPSR
jgi:hypothetical protein